MTTNKWTLRETLEEMEMLDAFDILETKLKSGMSKGAMLSAKQCHLVLMAVSHGRGIESALALAHEDYQNLLKGKKIDKSTKTVDESREIDKNRCLHRHNATGTRCILEHGHDGRHHYRCAGLACPGYPWVASEMQHPPSCILGDSPYNASRDELSACSCGSSNVEVSYPFNLPADAGIDPTGDFQHAQCLNCGKKGPAKQSIYEAIRAWNRIMMDVVKVQPLSTDREEKGKV